MDFIVNEKDLKVYKDKVLLYQIKDDIMLIIQRLDRIEDRLKGLEEKNIRELKNNEN